VLVHFSGVHLFPLFALGTILLLGALFGRILCGWVCPFGFVQDLLYKVPSRKISLPPWTGYIKYGVLGLGVLAIPFFLGESTLFSFCRICPASALQVSTPNLVIGGVATLNPGVMVKFGVLFGIVALAMTSSRSFCKTMCPIGALVGPLNHLAFWTVKRPMEACTTCRKCDKVCPVDGKPSERLAAGLTANRSSECLVCHDCQAVCPVPDRETRETEQQKTEKESIPVEV
jgi:polyferredoxin